MVHYKPLKDKFGDGMCCHAGEGHFAVKMGDREILRGGRFREETRYTIQVAPNYDRGLSARDQSWLDGHNTRRRKYHREFGGSYVPLQWSPQLAASALGWANELTKDCMVAGIDHEQGIEYGENMAKNVGSGGFGQLYPTENVMGRWVEKERHVGYPRNAHFTQAVWRASKYVGCGESHKTFNNGRTHCRIQVCRYARSGNCNMGAHKASQGNNWIAPMMADGSKCGAECAPEGCY